MSETEVQEALGTSPAQRKAGERGQVDVSYSFPGNPARGAAAHFMGEGLIWIQFGRGRGELPPLGRQVAQAIANGPLAVKAISGAVGNGEPLTMPELLLETRLPGQRVGWKLFEASNGAALTNSTWAWGLDRDDALLVDETDRTLHQPIIRRFAP